MLFELDAFPFSFRAFYLGWKLLSLSRELRVLQIGCLQVMRIEHKIYFLRLICEGCFRMQMNMDF